MDASAWLSDFERVERNVDDAFACLYERDAAQREGRAADATELTATVRKQAAELRVSSTRSARRWSCPR